ncbi:hypothetical protein V7S43_001850 [Phytophthora oleae]|uniref:Uncharacterized protein n=1 Tax=Phytophthora oleae TaxID=2107226 RepID=A0ABD3G0F5_9STRA
MAVVKLVEIRNAVAQLEQSNGSTGGRTASLKAAMASTMALEIALTKQVEKIAVGVITEHIDMNRKAHQDKLEAPTVPRNAAHSEPLPALNPEAELVLDSSSDSESESENEDEIGGSEAALKALMKAQHEPPSPPKQDLTATKKEMPKDTIVVAVDNSKSAVIRTRLPAAHLKPIVQEVDALPRKDRILITPDILLALKDSVLGDVDGRQRFEVISSLKFVVKWASDATRQVQYASSYRAYAEAATAYVDDLPVYSEQTAEIDRLVSELNCKLKRFSPATNSTGSTGDPASSTSNPIKPFVAFSKRVFQIDKMPFSKHRQQMLGLLVSFKSETSVPLTNSRSKRVNGAVDVVVRWMRDAPRKPELLCLYALLVDAIRKLGMQAETFVVLADIMLELIAETPSYRVQHFLAHIKARAAKLLKEVKRRDICSTARRLIENLTL